MKTGRECDNCGHHLSDEEFSSYGSWNYTCDKCGFKYRHSSSKTASEQIEEFNSDTDDEDSSDPFVVAGFK